MARAMSASGEPEPVGVAGEHPDLGVGGLDESVREAVVSRRERPSGGGCEQCLHSTGVWPGRRRHPRRRAPGRACTASRRASDLREIAPLVRCWSCVPVFRPVGDEVWPCLREGGRRTVHLFSSVLFRIACIWAIRSWKAARCSARWACSLVIRNWICSSRTSNQATAGSTPSPSWSGAMAVRVVSRSATNRMKSARSAPCRSMRRPPRTAS